MTTRRALAFSFMDRYAGLIIAIISSAIIARLLTPKESGIFSVTMVVLSFASAIRDMGAGQYLLQEPDLTTARLQATWTVMLSIGCSLALVAFAIAKPVADFYAEPSIQPIMWLLSLNFALSPFGSMTYAWLMREMSFGKLAVMRFVSTLLGAITSIFFAWRGHGPISLAYGSVAATLTNALCAQAFRPKRFPWLPGGLTEIKRVLGFGSKISATTLINNFAFGSPELFLGKMQDMNAVGLFSRANGLVTMFNKLVMDATSSVALSSFAKTARSGRIPRDEFIKANLYISAIGWTFFSLVGIHADQVLLLLYGAQWHHAVNSTRLLSIGMAAGILAALCPTTLTAIGRADLVLRTSIINALMYALFMGIGAYFGLLAIGCMFILANTIGALTWLSTLKSTLDLEIRQYLILLIPSLILAGASATPSLLILIVDPDWMSDLARAMAGSLLGLGVFMIAAPLLKHPISAEIKRLSNIFR